MIVQYFYLGKTQSKAKLKKHSKSQAFAIAFDGYVYHRTLKSRGWTDAKEVFSRRATPEEERLQRECFRVIMGRYETLDALLEDEREILGADSEPFRNLERTLRAVVEQNRYHPDI